MDDEVVSESSSGSESSSADEDIDEGGSGSQSAQASFEDQASQVLCNCLLTNIARC